MLCSISTPYLCIRGNNMLSYLPIRVIIRRTSTPITILQHTILDNYTTQHMVLGGRTPYAYLQYIPRAPLSIDAWIRQKKDLDTLRYRKQPPPIDKYIQISLTLPKRAKTYKIFRIQNLPFNKIFGVDKDIYYIYRHDKLNTYNEKIAAT